MTGDSKFFIGVVLAAILVVGGIILYSGNKPQPTIDNIDLSLAQKLGDDLKPIKIVEFGDFQCPACQTAAVPLRAIYEKNKETVQLSFFHFPLPQHKNAFPAALASEAAGKQGQFWEMYDLIYENQIQWESLSEPNNAFKVFAQELNLNAEQFLADLDDSAAKSRIQSNADYGSALGVNQTPTFFINGQRYTGSQTESDWQIAIDAAKPK